MGNDNYVRYLEKQLVKEVAKLKRVSKPIFRCFVSFRRVIYFATRAKYSKHDALALSYTAHHAVGAHWNSTSDVLIFLYNFSMEELPEQIVEVITHEYLHKAIKWCGPSIENNIGQEKIIFKLMNKSMSHSMKRKYKIEELKNAKHIKT